MIYYIDAANLFYLTGSSGIAYTCFPYREKKLSMSNTVLPVTGRLAKYYLKMIIYELGIIYMGVQ
ncbi:MAG: hypothetical protein PWP14_2014 [Methanolobus sp.]|jgi:hypothetical protein|nr:hypothetical protein [Methanolobus sp.]